MDLNTIDALLMPSTLAELPRWQPGDAWLGGGTWLFSEPQPKLRRLIDLTTLGWPPIILFPEGLSVAATCTIAQLHAFAAESDLPAAALMAQCCRSLLGSFKVWNMATVGGNICMALPAGPLTSLAASLEAEAVVWSGGDSASERRVRVVDLVRGVRQTALEPGDILRSIEIAPPALHARTAFRRIALNPLGRSGALVIGVLDPQDGGFALTVTAATPRPVRLAFASIPSAETLLASIDAAIPPGTWYDDVHGLPDWRRAVTRRFAAEIRDEFAP